MRNVAIFFILLLTAGLALAQPYGDTIGTTLYSYQNTGPTGRRIAVCDDFSIYVCWINWLNWPYPSLRHVCVNWRSPEGEWAGQMQVSQDNGVGYCNVDNIYGNRGAIAYHGFSDEYNIFIAIDWEMPGMGFFDYYQVPNEIYPQSPDNPGECLWPQLTVDCNNRMHVVMTEITDRNPRRFCYSRSDDGGLTWLAPIEIDTVDNITGTIVSSPVSDRVAITYLNPVDTLINFNYWPFYVISEDGQNWNAPDDITQVPYPFGPGGYRWGTLNHTAIFDNNDDLHIAWPAYGDSSDYLFHYDISSDSIIVITQLPSLPNHPLIFTRINQISLSRQRNSSALYASWCQFADGDTSAAGEYNGDLFMCLSDDLGLTWDEPVNLTNSPSPDCGPMECTSEIFPSAPEEADSMPQLTYLFDPSDSELLVMYLEPDDLVGINDHLNQVPDRFALYQNYPNPFNALSEIRFDLPEEGMVELAVYDILGRKLETLIDEFRPSGSHSVVWDARDYASGIYFYRLQHGDKTEIRKCLLIK
jgi:hypothetical protein